MQLALPGMPDRPAPKKRTRKFRLQPQPVCPVHGVPMLAGSTTKFTRYCYCPVDGCKQSCKQSRVRWEDFERELRDSINPELAAE